MSGARFWRITAPQRTLVLRRWPLEHPSPGRLQFIHAVLFHAAQRDIAFLPLPIRATNGTTFIQHSEHLWELTPWMAGQADYDLAPSIEKLRAAMQMVARFHVAVADFEPTKAADQRVFVPAPAIARRLARLYELQRGGADRLALAVSRSIWPDLTLIADQFLSSLTSGVSRAIAQLAPLASINFMLQPCLRDVWHDHILFMDHEVTGVIDFGAMDFDIPACDVARLLGSLAPDDVEAWRNGIAAYSAVRPISPDESRAVTALDVSGTVLAGCNWLRWIYLEQRQFDDQCQVVERFRKIVARCSRLSEGETL